jgi:hypothetical protein
MPLCTNPFPRITTMSCRLASCHDDSSDPTTTREPMPQSHSSSTIHLRHSCTCGRLLGIQIGRAVHIKHQKIHIIVDGSARITCGRCRRATTLAPVDRSPEPEAA